MNQPSFSTYTYWGAHQNVAFRMANIHGETVIVFQDVLITGRDYLLPDDHSIVKAWVSAKHITKSEGVAQ